MGWFAQSFSCQTQPLLRLGWGFDNSGVTLPPLTHRWHLAGLTTVALMELSTRCGEWSDELAQHEGGQQHANLGVTLTLSSSNC